MTLTMQPKSSRKVARQIDASILKEGPWGLQDVTGLYPALLGRVADPKSAAVLFPKSSTFYLSQNLDLDTQMVTVPNPPQGHKEYRPQSQVPRYQFPSTVPGKEVLQKREGMGWVFLKKLLKSSMPTPPLSPEFQLNAVLQQWGGTVMSAHAQDLPPTPAESAPTPCRQPHLIDLSPLG